MQSIHPGKNEPNTLIEGAPRQPLRNKAARTVNAARPRSSRWGRRGLKFITICSLFPISIEKLWAQIT